jgi:hypothetical protein
VILYTLELGTQRKEKYLAAMDIKMMNESEATSKTTNVRKYQESSEQLEDSPFPQTTANKRKKLISETTAESTTETDEISSSSSSFNSLTEEERLKRMSEALRTIIEVSTVHPRLLSSLHPPDIVSLQF